MNWKRYCVVLPPRALLLFFASLAHRRPQVLEEFGLLHAREAMRALYMDSLEEFVEDRGASRPFVNSHTRIPEYLLSLLSVL